MKTSKSESITITTHNHSKPERDKPNKMKIININVQRIIALITFTVCLLIMYWGDEEPTNVTVILSMAAFFYFGFISRRPHPDEKPLIIWLKICILKVQIWHKQAYLYFYPDLNKFKRQDQKLFRNKIKLERIKLDELKRELKELV